MAFDYGAFKPETRQRLREIALNGRRKSDTIAREMCEMGQLLAEANDLIGTQKHNGNENLWSNFCRYELQMEPRDARRLMAIYRGFGTSPPLDIVPTALEILAPTHLAAREEARERSSAGERITVRIAHEIAKRHAGTPKIGSNAGVAPRITSLLVADNYKLRSAIRMAFSSCPPKDRTNLCGRLHELIDVIWREVDESETPVGRGAHKGSAPPDLDTIAAKTAEIRETWSDADFVKRRRELAT